MFNHVSALQLARETNVGGQKISMLSCVTLIDETKCQGNLRHIANSTNNLHHTVRHVLFTTHEFRRLYWRPGAHLEFFTGGRGTEPEATYFMFHFQNYFIKSRCKHNLT